MPKSLLRRVQSQVQVLAALSVCAFASLSHAQIAVGVVDEDKLAQGYTKYREAIVALDTQAQALDGQLEARELLSAEEAKQFDEAIMNFAPTPVQKTALETLVKSGTSRRAELIGLIGKSTRSEADNKRLNELNALAGGNSLSVRAVQDKLYSLIKQNQERIDQQNTDRANSVIEQVASEKKLTLVWRKRAIIWNSDSIDITQEVLTRLNKA